MAHEVESMMYAGQVPWHGLGTYVGDKAVDAATAMKESGLDWRVKKVPLTASFVGNDGRNYESKTDEYFGVVRNTDLKMLGVVESRYQVFQNKDCFDFMDSVVGPTADLEYHTAGSLRGGKTVWMLAKLKNFIIEPIKGDVTESFLLLSTSHDGSAALKQFFTPVRVVCANTLAQAMGSKTGGMSIRHTGDLDGKVKQAQKVLGLVVDEKRKYKELTEYLAKLKIGSDDAEKFLDHLLPIPKDKNPTRTKNVRSKIVQLHEYGKGSDIPGVRGTGWGWFNAVTEYLNHEKTYKQMERTTSADNRLHSLWFGQGANMVEKAKRILVDEFA